MSFEKARAILAKLVVSLVIIGMGCAIAACYRSWQRLTLTSNVPTRPVGAVRSDIQMPVVNFLTNGAKFNVNGTDIGVEMCGDTVYQEKFRAIVATLGSKGWKRIEGEGKNSVKDVLDSAIFEKNSDTTMVMAHRGPAGNVMIVSYRIDKKVADLFKGTDPLLPGSDATGKDIAAVPRPLDSKRIYSLIQPDGAGFAVYRPDRVTSNYMCEYESVMSKAGWAKVYSAGDSGFGWYAKGKDQCQLWMSSSGYDTNKYITVVYYGNK